LKKQYLQKEEQYQVEVNILKCKLEEKDKILRLQDNTNILDNILSIQRYSIIKTSLGFHESIEGESSSQDGERNSNEKSKIHNKEMRGQPHQQPRKGIHEIKSFTPNCGSDSRLFPPMNNAKCLYVIILDMLQ